MGCIADAPGWVHFGIVLKEPWVHDADMERLAEDFLASAAGDTIVEPP